MIGFYMKRKSGLKWVKDPGKQQPWKFTAKKKSNTA